MRTKTRSRQKLTTGFKTRLIIAASCFLLIAGGIFISLNVGNVEDTFAAVPGDYRSKSSGNWEDATVWEVFDGKKWRDAENIPSDNNKRILIKSGTGIKVNVEITVSELIIDKNAILQANHSFLHIKSQGNSGGITVKGILDAGNCIIDGDGAFNLKDNAEIIIGSREGLSKSNSGNIQVTGNRYYSSFARYTYKSIESQKTGSALPMNVAALTIDNPSDVELENNVYVTSLLHLKKGTLKTGTDTLILGMGKTSNALIKREHGGISGNFKRWLNKTTMKEALFPMVDGANYNAVFITVNPEDYTSGAFTFNFIPEKIKKNEHLQNKNTRVISIGESGYYNVTSSDGFENGIFKLVVSIAVSKNENKNHWVMSAKLAEVDERKTKPVSDITGLISNITITPNPFKEKFTVRFNLSSAAQVEINLLNSNGQLVVKEVINAQEAENKYEYSDQRGLPKGNYILRIITGNTIETRKVIKQ